MERPSPQEAESPASPLPEINRECQEVLVEEEAWMQVSMLGFVSVVGCTYEGWKEVPRMLSAGLL